MIWLNLKYVFSHPQKWSEFWHFEKLWILALVCTHMEIFGFEVNHGYIIQYLEAVEHNSWTFEVHFDTFSVFQTVWGILSVIFSTIFRHFEANTCRNFELEEDFCWVRLKIGQVRSMFLPHFARFPIVVLKIAEMLS